MIGFIKKDLLMIKNNLKAFTFVFIIYVFMAFNGMMDISFLLSFISVMLVLSTFNYDNYNKWEVYAITLPDGKKNVVKSKYLTTLLLVVMTSLISVLITFLVMLINKQVNYEGILQVFVANVTSIIIIEVFMYPFIFKLGIEKARIWIFVVLLALALILGILSNFISLEFLTGVLNFIVNYYFIVPPIIIIMLYLSYLMSKYFYLKKEF